MAEKKVTIKENLLKVRDVLVKAEETELVEFIDGRLEVLESKKANAKLTETQKENVVLKDLIVEILKANGDKMTITEMQNADEKLATLKNQKISALLKQLVDTKAVAKVTDKKKSYFTIAE